MLAFGEMAKFNNEPALRHDACGEARMSPTALEHCDETLGIVIEEAATNDAETMVATKAICLNMVKELSVVGVKFVKQKGAATSSCC